MRPLESKIENYLKTETEKRGGLCLKFNSGVIGVPDRIILLDGQTYFVECKRPGEKPRASQVSMHRKMNRCGIAVYVVDTKEAVDAFFKDETNGTIRRADEPKQQPMHSLLDMIEPAKNKAK